MKSARLVRLSFLVLVVLSGLLSACDPRSYPYLSVYRVQILEQQPVVQVCTLTSFGLEMSDGCIAEAYYTSPDEGKTWHVLAAAPGSFSPIGEEMVQDDAVVCVQAAPQSCYRLTSAPVLEISRDGGQTWQIDWQLPAGRQPYLARHPDMVDLIGVVPDLIPYDLEILETSAGYVVIAACGNQGVLVKSAAGSWQRVPVWSENESVRSAVPFPSQAANLSTALQNTASENTWIGTLAFTWLILFGALILFDAAKKSPGARPSIQGWLITVVVLSGVSLLLLGWLFLTLHTQNEPYDLSFFNNLLIYICPMSLMMLGMGLFYLALEVPKTVPLWIVFGLALVSGVLFFTLTWLPIGLWALGVFDEYPHALLGSLILALITMGLSILAERILLPRLCKP